MKKIIFSLGILIAVAGATVVSYRSTAAKNTRPEVSVFYDTYKANGDPDGTVMHLFRVDGSTYQENRYVIKDPETGKFMSAGISRSLNLVGHGLYQINSNNDTAEYMAKATPYGNESISGLTADQTKVFGYEVYKVGGTGEMGMYWSPELQAFLKYEMEDGSYWIATKVEKGVDKSWFELPPVEKILYNQYICESQRIKDKVQRKKALSVVPKGYKYKEPPMCGDE